MFPPIEDGVLQNNPQFAVLYSTLTTSILNPDGSTKNDPAAKERAAVREKLDEYRLKTAKQHLLTHAITTADPKSLQTRHVPAPSLTRRARPQPQAPTPANAELPEPLLDLLLLLPLILTTPSDIDPDSAALLLSSPPLSDLPTHLPLLATLVSSALHTSAVSLARIANPSTNPSYIHRSIPSLPSQHAALLQSPTSSSPTLTSTRRATTAALTTLLHAQTAAVLAPLLRTLEAKHGPVARSLELRAHETSLAAQRQACEADAALARARRETYTPEAARALANYASHLRDARTRLAERVRMVARELEEYGVGVVGRGVGGEDGTGVGVVVDGEAEGEDDGGRESEGMGGAGPRPGSGGGASKEKVMREMARVYRDIGRQVEEVRADLERLGVA